MLILLTTIFLIVTAIAIAFAVWPVLRAPGKPLGARIGLASALALAVFGIAGGCYVMLGQPQLALRSLQGDSATDPAALIARLGRHMVQSPEDARGWTLLGQAYLNMGDADQAAKAFAEGLARQGKPDPELLAIYGESLVLNAGGAVTADAEKIFQQAVAANPNEEAARYYLGLADMQRGNAQNAETIWQALIDDMAPDNPLRGFVLDRLVQVKAQSDGGVDVRAMVEGLAARLKAEPRDGEGWRRLVRAYSVLGETEKAKAALQGGRAALAADVPAREALETEARELNLN